ncbi:caprin-1-like [Liolophura sinensis]|uniref:caprin-1-like n=1 Tax=Liolophura sinensis TaxID=3198878 RepID=UPI003159586E
MPAASTKPETKSSSEAMEPIKQAISLLDKKVRNLEKRKSKLDSYKEKANKGNQLEKDQEEAIAHYTEVIQNLEFAKDLQKQYVTICVDSEKILKKQAKREKAERQLVEVKRFRELLQLQGMLDSLGSETVRSDFKTGKHGAVVLTDENLNQMDELYKLISPSREGEKDYQEQLTQAAEHVSNLLDGKDKEVVGTTYKELRELMDLINNCGYFENIPCYGETEPQEDTAAEVTSTEVESPVVTEPVVIEDPQPILAPVVPNDQVTGAYTQPIEAEVLEAEAPEHTAPMDQEYHAYSAANAAYNRQRPFQEIVSSVQGSFNFLQESEIDIESPHMDPAVVAMGPAPIPHPSATPSDSPTLPAQTLLADAHLPQPTQQPSQTPHHLDPTDPQKAMADYSNQNYNHAPANFAMDDAVTTHSTQNQTILSEAASAGLPDPAVAGIIPAHMPIPNQSNPLSQDDLQAANQPEKKPFTMNANAAVFQSMYSQSGGAGALDKPVSPQSAEYQSNYQGNNYRGGSGGNRGFRGGRGGRGGVSNGYSRSGSRGGSVNGRGGFNRDNRDGDRVPYQGYPPRSDYRPDGYQGYNNNSGYYNKRGGPNRGGMRGGSRGGSGGGRGGPRSGYGRPMNQQQTISQ